MKKISLILISLMLINIILILPLLQAQEQSQPTDLFSWIYNSITNLWEHWFGGQVIETSMINPNETNETLEPIIEPPIINHTELTTIKKVNLTVNKFYPITNQEEVYLNKQYKNDSNIIISSPTVFQCEWYPDNSPKKNLKKCTIEFQTEDLNTGKNLSIKGTADLPKYYQGHFDINTSNKDLFVFKSLTPVWKFEYSNKSNEYNKIINFNGTTNLIIPEKEFKDYQALDTTKLNSIITKDIYLDPDINSCGILSSSGTYTLNASISNNSIVDNACINITAQNVTLDCAGFSITSTANKTGVYSEQLNTTIKNCNISIGTDANINYGIYLLYANNSNIINNTINAEEYYGMFVGQPINNILIENNSVNVSTWDSDGDPLTSTALWLSGGYNCTIRNNTFQTHGGTVAHDSFGILDSLVGFGDLEGNNLIINNFINSPSIRSPDGIYMVLINNENLTGNIINSNGYGILIDGTNGTNITYNNISSDNSIAIYLYNSRSLLISNNATGGIIGGENTGGIILDSSNYSNLINNTGKATYGSSSYGIRIYQNSNYNNLTGNIGISDTSYGITIQTSYFNTLINNNGTARAGNGFYISFSSNNSIINNTFFANSTVATNFRTVSYINFTGNNITSQYNRGATIQIVSFSNFTNNIFYGCSLGGTENGVSLIGISNNNTFINNYFTTNATGAGNGFVTAFNVNRNNFINNTGVSVLGFGMQIASSSNNVLINNTGISTNLTGLILNNANNNTLSGNRGISTSGIGLALQTAKNNTLYNDYGNSNSNYSVYLIASNYNNLTNIRAEGNSTNSYGIVLNNTNNTIIKDSINISGVNGDVLFATAKSFNNTFLNCSYRTTGTNESILAGSSLLRKWYYQAYVNNTAGNGINGVNINATNVSGTSEFNLTTNSSGYINITTITEYVNNGTIYYYSNYSINVSKDNYLNQTRSENITLLNNIFDYFTLNETNNPNVTNLITNPNSPTSYSPSKDYQFNATIIDDVGISNVYFQFDNVNYSVSNISNSYYITFSNLPVGTYNYLWIVNDTGNNKNYSEGGTYQIIQNNTYVLSLTSSEGWTILASTYSTITGSDCPSQLTCNLYQSGTNVANPFTNIFPAGSYLFVFNTSGNVNYSTASVNNILISQINGSSGINGTIPINNFPTITLKINCNKGVSPYCDCTIYGIC